jgi:hypothetical protein
MDLQFHRQFVQKLQTKIKNLGEPLPPIGDKQYGGIAGTLGIKSKLTVIEAMMNNCPILGFIDLGSGNGDMCYAVAGVCPFIPVMGIESSEMIVQHATDFQDHVCSALSIADPKRITFVCDNILLLREIPIDCSHVFSFATGMPDHVITHMLDLVCNKALHVRQFCFIYRNAVSISKLEKLIKCDRIKNIQRISVTMLRSAEKHPLFVIDFKEAEASIPSTDLQ